MMRFLLYGKAGGCHCYQWSDPSVPGLPGARTNVRVELQVALLALPATAG